MTAKYRLEDCFEQITDLYSPHILLEANDSQLMLVIVEGEKVPWHTHENEDEVFFVIEGSLTVYTREEQVSLEAGEMLKISKGVEHKVSSEGVAKIMLIESRQVTHTGNVKSEISKTTFPYLKPSTKSG